MTNWYSDAVSSFACTLLFSRNNFLVQFNFILIWFHWFYLLLNIYILSDNVCLFSLIFNSFVPFHTFTYIQPIYPTTLCRRRTSYVLPEIRILAPSLERGLDESSSPKYERIETQEDQSSVRYIRLYKTNKQFAQTHMTRYKNTQNSSTFLSVKWNTVHRKTKYNHMNNTHTETELLFLSGFIKICKKNQTPLFL